MTRTLRYLLLFIFTGLSGSVFAQEISGRIIDETKQGIISATVQAFQGGILKGGNVTDYDGNYFIKPLESGTYDVLISYIGYDSIWVKGVPVSPDGKTTINKEMKKPSVGKLLKETVVVAYKNPVISDNPGKTAFSNADIAKLPTTNVNDIASQAANVYQTQRGAGLSLGGARQEGTVYIIDGVVVRGSAQVSQGGIDNMEVISSGIPANYGDVMGGIVNITTRSVSQKFNGSVRLQHSIDGYNNNLVNFSVSGPLYKKTITVDGNKMKKPVLGYALSADYYEDHDRYPSFDPQYTAKGDVLKNIQKNPLKIVSDNTGNPVYNNASTYITYSDLQSVKAPSHNITQEARLNGKLVFQLADNVSITAGGAMSYTKADQYNRALSLFAPETTPVLNTLSGRGFIRFTQKFGKATDTGHSIISNAFYKIQIDYQKNYNWVEDTKFGKSIFDYGYVGKFYEKRSPFYNIGTDSASKAVAVILGGTSTSTFLDKDNGVTFVRSEKNPNLANYTTQLYDYNGGVPFSSLLRLEANNGIANGDQPKFAYGMFYSPGATQTGYSFVNADQYALTLDASFDLMLGKTRHAIEFGLYYQQRVERSYSVSSNPNGTGTVSLWQLMRQEVSSYNNSNLALDKQHPIFRVNGKSFTLDDVKNGKVIPGPSDTIIYNYKNIGNTPFDQALRKKLGYANNRSINIDSLDPSTFSLDMFSADELLNSGNSFVGYQGYTYTGQVQNGTVNFNDFWTAKDANGNNTRPLGAFSPNYTAGYILDKFSFKDISFNIGVRIDRYTANTKVLIDPFSLIGEKTVNEVTGAHNILNGGVHPANISGGYVVYVDNNSSNNPNVIGYRSGTNWYDPYGNYINDPATLKKYSGGQAPQPYLVNGTTITDSNFNPNLSFTDYTPQVNIMPRIQFSFPISDYAKFYAHYDIYTMRPTSGNNANPETYYYLQQNAQGTIANPNLKPQKTFDYEVGFQQKLNDRSSLTISASYKQRKDMITVVPYLYAYPTTYYSYGNRDFSATKGTALIYDLRATNHLAMNITYTLQFSEGSGSSPDAGSGGLTRGLLGSLVEAGLPYLRYNSPQNNDSRHSISASIDYRYLDGEGPMVGNKLILQNCGLHIIGKARSGEPYSRYTDASYNVIVGGVNGARLPWHYGVDLRLDKDFAVDFGGKHKSGPDGVKAKHPRYIKGILQVNNLLQTRDILHVYGFTGKPDDNGYLTSSYGQQTIPAQTDPQSYIDLYRISRNSPGNINYARTISLALEFNF